ncbi:unnamed protein product [Rotaria sp. Silwood2]|nr:unnamed protein product [Rotaria sp. Silwood2]CAF2791051.1 unnamed protein product [Rotaria sp. Silwood2]CAF3363726.1 unnamed protein product [Rotaria sp. Silwood2]CAF4395051.1 unnamed protein product [Rotaria sp. Silwood2]CAF4400260.1 unnamed protein product [Rotaria sp. Silwood2]
MTRVLKQAMNPRANEFIPDRNVSYDIPTNHLTQKQKNILHEITMEWFATPTLDELLLRWETRSKQTKEMMRIKSELKIMLLNVSSLSLYLPNILVLLENVSCPIIVFNGIHHDDEAIKTFSKHFSNYNIYSQEGTNKFGGILTAVHRSITVQRVNVFQKMPNVLALDIGTSHGKFQLATCYSPPNESLPLALFEQIIKRNKNTILLGDFNAKHQSWSKSNENQKGRVLFNWLSANSLMVVNKGVPTSTRSSAKIDLILTSANLIGTSSSFSVLPSMGSDHFPVIWVPTIKLIKSDCQYPVKRTY